MITQERLKELLHYDPATGVFTWRRAKGPWMKAGMRAGSINTDGYRQIKISGEAYSASRLAWLYMTGAWPPGELDHKDLDEDHNAFENLRPATRAQNVANQKARRDGLKGTRKMASGRFIAQITISGQTIHLGTFDTEAAAHAAYMARAIGAFGEFANSGQ